MTDGRIKSGERLIWMGIIAALVIVSVSLTVVNVRLRRSADAAAVELEHIRAGLGLVERDIAGYEAVLDSLRGRLDAASASIGGGESAGLADKLAGDLIAHPELIPYDGVLGGTMGFYSRDSVRVLSDRWVLASFEDGHRMGRMLLRYDVTDNGIVWKVIDSYIE